MFKGLSTDIMVDKNLLITKKCYCETTVRVQTKRFIWPIPRFLSLSEYVRVTYPVFSCVKEIPTLYATLFKTENKLVDIVIRRTGDKSKAAYVRCKISAVNTPKGVDWWVKRDHLYKSEEESDTWTFYQILKYRYLEKNGYFKMNDGVLYLQFDFAFSIQDQLHHIEKQDGESLIPPPTYLVPENAFPIPTTTNDKHTVVTLRAEQRTFQVHSALFKAKSEMFHRMLESDMKEKETGVVDIKGVGPETLGRMVSYLNCETLGDLSVADVQDLYSAAHTYQILGLVDHCSTVLKSFLTASNVCDILLFADFYNDEQLLESAKDFIVACRDPDRILLSQSWKDIMTCNVTMAANFMHKMLTRLLCYFTIF